MSIITVNGISDEEIGVRVVGAVAPWGRHETRRVSVGPMGHVGRVPARFGQGAPRVTAVQMRTATNVAGRRAKLDEVYSWLDGTLEVEWSDEPGRFRICNAESIPVAAPHGPSYVYGEVHLSVRFIEYTPVAFAKTPELIAIGPEAQPCRHGTLPTIPVSRHNGPFDSLDTLLRGINGLVRGRVTLTGEVAGDEYVEIDHGTHGVPHVIHYKDGVRTEDHDLQVTATDFFRIDPADGDYAAEAWPTVESSAPGVMDWRRAWA